MKLIKKSIILMIAALVAAVMGFASPANADRNGHGNADWDTAPLSKSDFRQYCKDVHGAKLRSLAPHDAYSLRCGQLDIDVTDVCNYTYGYDVKRAYGREIGLIDRLADVGKRYSGWGCMLDFGVARDVTEADLVEWCEDKYGRHLSHVDTKYKAYQWRCTDDYSGDTTGIRMDDLCIWLSGTDTLDRVRNVYDEYSWECRYSKE